MHAAYGACEAAGLVAVGVGWRAGERELGHLAQRTGAEALIVERNRVTSPAPGPTPTPPEPLP